MFQFWKFDLQEIDRLSRLTNGHAGVFLKCKFRYILQTVHKNGVYESRTKINKKAIGLMAQMSTG